MTVIWLIVWLFNSTPNIQYKHDGNWDLNNWAIALTICLALDIFGGSSKAIT